MSEVIYEREIKGSERIERLLNRILALLIFSMIGTAVVVVTTLISVFVGGEVEKSFAVLGASAFITFCVYTMRRVLIDRILLHRFGIVGTMIITAERTTETEQSSVH